MENLSVTIITKNEEKNIGRCLASLKWADEIVVVDTNSTDRTVEICRQHTEQVFSESWHGYGKQKNICAMHAKNRWILNIDADEVVTSTGRLRRSKKFLKKDHDIRPISFQEKITSATDGFDLAVGIQTKYYDCIIKKRFHLVNPRCTKGLSRVKMRAP